MTVIIAITFVSSNLSVLEEGPVFGQIVCCGICISLVHTQLGYDFLILDYRLGDGINQQKFHFKLMCTNMCFQQTAESVISWFLMQHYRPISHLQFVFSLTRCSYKIEMIDMMMQDLLPLIQFALQMFTVLSHHSPYRISSWAFRILLLNN